MVNGYYKSEVYENLQKETDNWIKEKERQDMFKGIFKGASTSAAAQAQQDCGTTMARPSDRRSIKSTRPDKIEHYKRQIAILEQEKLAYHKAISELSELSFKVGDVAVHKELGNCIIMDLQTPASRELSSELDAMTLNHCDKEGYWAQISSPKCNHPIEWVPLKELVPYSNASQILYKKDK